MKLRVLLLLLLFPILATSATAAPTIKLPVKMVGLKVSTTITLTSDPNDEIDAITLTPSLVVLAGTSARAGFISAYDRTGSSMLWNTKLGGPEESIATALIRDSRGNFWVAGASTTSTVSPPPPTIPPGTLNPAGVQQETSTALASLSQLDMWELSTKGALLNTFSVDLTRPILPQNLSIKGEKITIEGAIGPNDNEHFAITSSFSGHFGLPRILSTVDSGQGHVKEVKTSLSTWRSFTTSTAIKGLPSWKPKPNSHVLARYDLKTKALISAFLAPGEIVDFAWEKSVGVIALVATPNGYGLGIIK